MFVTAIKNVNRRQEKASAASLCPGYIPIGQSVEVLGVTGGDDIDGNSLWYCSAAGEFLWSGGFAPTSELLQADGKPLVVPAEVLINVYESALHELCSWFLSEITGCKGLALGHKNNDRDGDLSLVALVDAKLDDAKTPVPATVNYRGVALATDVRETGGIKAGVEAADVYPDNGTMIQAGGGTLGEHGDPKNSFGTRTLLVYSDGKPFILTCYHVACHSLTKGGVLSLPAGQTVEVDIPAKVAESPISHSGKVTEGCLAGQFDYALVSVDGTDWLAPEIVDIGECKEFYGLPELSYAALQGLPVMQFGARTHEVREGVITGYRTDTVNITYAGVGDIGISGLIISSAVSQQGDSGAPVVDEAGKLLGHVIAFDKSGTYIMPFAYLNYYKSITLTLPK